MESEPIQIGCCLLEFDDFQIALSPGEGLLVPINLPLTFIPFTESQLRNRFSGQGFPPSNMKGIFLVLLCSNGELLLYNDDLRERVKISNFVRPRFESIEIGGISFGLYTGKNFRAIDELRRLESAYSGRNDLDTGEVNRNRELPEITWWSLN